MVTFGLLCQAKPAGQVKNLAFRLDTGETHVADMMYRVEGGRVGGPNRGKAEKTEISTS